jgi:photosystem II stability/assembly factor-like uncharacterized protein
MSASDLSEKGNHMRSKACLWRKLTALLFFIGMGLFPAVSWGALTQFSSTAGEVRDILQTSVNTLYAATQGGGIYKTTDGGQTWTRLASFPEHFVWRLAGYAANTQLIYAANGKGLFKSEDGGTNWTQQTFDHVNAVAVDPYNQNHVLIGVPGAGIYQSLDGGATFALANTGLDSLDVTSIAFSPASNNVVYAGLSSNVGADWGGVFKSTDGGSTWNSWNNPGGAGAIGNKFITALAVDSQGNLHAGSWHPATYSGGLYKQTGSGGWSLRREVYGVETIVLDRSTAGKLWAGTKSFGPWKSTDYGGTWNQAVNPGLDPEVYSTVYSLMTFSGSPGKVLAGVKGLGFYLTMNDGGVWNLTGTGLNADRGRSLAAYPQTNPSTYYFGLAGGGVMKSTNAGMSWFHLDTGLKVDSVENNLTVAHLGISTSNGNNIYAATYGRGLFHWTGAEWTRVAEAGIPNDAYAFLKPMGLVVDRLDDRVVYYSLFDQNQGVYRRDGTGVWSRVLAGPFTGSGASKIVQSSLNPLKLYALNHDELPSVSTNGGSSWARINATHSGFMRLSFFSLAENPFDSSILLASTNKGLFRSTNGGFDWSPVSPVSGLESAVLTGLVFSPLVSGRLWGTDLGGRYYCSNDNGSTWVAKADALLGSPIVDLKIIDGVLYLITDGSGVLRDASPNCP